MKVFQNHNPSEIQACQPHVLEDVFRFHRALPGYAPTPLISMDGIAGDLGMGRLLVKDEGRRFGLKAFKALGASYAVYRVLHERSGGRLEPGEFVGERGRELADGITFSCATDGNHGRAVAWIAGLLGRPAVIYVPEETVPARIDAIRSEGAQVVVVDGGYDDAVRRAEEECKDGRMIIADIAYPGYIKIPRYIQQGYLTIFREISLQLEEEGEEPPDIVFIQAGVGAFASAAAQFFNNPSNGVRLVCAEPQAADCLFQSAEAGDGILRSISSGAGTIMAGLNCETPSLTAWPDVRDRFDVFVSMEDHWAEEAMRSLAAGGVMSGESGAAGLASLIALCAEMPGFLGEELHLRDNARILVINTEADTDPEGYRRIIGKESSLDEKPG
ncbi:MAG: diaminopropionate ammonia-lyase [Deltaproteobacteria bacterium]|nr:diaminopropionate ammonia-lyase [Deltaproteobacteria bacterium]